MVVVVLLWGNSVVVRIVVLSVEKDGFVVDSSVVAGTELVESVEE